MCGYNVGRCPLRKASLIYATFWKLNPFLMLGIRDEGSYTLGHGFHPLHVIMETDPSFRTLCASNVLQLMKCPT